MEGLKSPWRIQVPALKVLTEWKEHLCRASDWKWITLLTKIKVIEIHSLIFHVALGSRYENFTWLRENSCIRSYALRYRTCDTNLECAHDQCGSELYRQAMLSYNKISTNVVGAARRLVTTSSQCRLLSRIVGPTLRSFYIWLCIFENLPSIVKWPYFYNECRKNP